MTADPARFAPSSARSIERLETRRLLASIAGNVWQDADFDGFFDFFETPFEGLTVYLDENANGTFDTGEQTTTTDADGAYLFDNLPVPTPFDPITQTGGELYYVGLTNLDTGGGPALAQSSPGIAGAVSTRGGFNIDIVYATPLGPDLELLVESAVAKWEQIIVGDLADVGAIDDLQLTVSIESIDGPGGTLASANFDALRAGPNGLPFQSSTRADLDDSQIDLEFVETITHEIGHALGFGTLWNGEGDRDVLLIGGRTPAPRYIGANGVEEFNRLYGLTETSVPVEGFINGAFQPGSSGGHWDEDFFGREIMSTSADGGAVGVAPDAGPVESFSRMTIGAIEDLGYEVSYAGAEPFGPFGIGALPEDFDPSAPQISFHFGVLLEDVGEAFEAANFGVRENTDPAPFFFNAGPEFVEAGQTLDLLAELDSTFDTDFDGDVDFRDLVIQTNFFLESNGTPGLQTPGDVRRGNATTADTLLSQDANASDGFAFNFDTTGLANGDYTVYAQAFDRGYFDTVRTDTFAVVSGQTAPGKPIDLRVIGSSSDSFLIEFLDDNTNETGYLLQVSSNPNFDDPDAIDNVILDFLPDVDPELLDPDFVSTTSLDRDQRAGTGIVRYEYTLPGGESARQDNQNATRFFRLRAFNTAGSSQFAGRAEARTLGEGEVLIDNAADTVTRSGFTVVSDPTLARGVTFLSGDNATATFAATGLLSPGRYQILASTVGIASPGETLIELLDGGTVLASRVVDAAGAGSEVLLGTFDLDDDAAVRFSSTGNGTATADVVRFLPAG
jgi:hypothetical protein